MNRLFFMIVLLFIFIVPQAWGQIAKHPNPYRQTMWNNLTDSVHTLGQSPVQASSTKMKLHAARTKVRLKSINQANAAQYKAKRQAWLNSQNSSNQ